MSARAALAVCALLLAGGVTAGGCASAGPDGFAARFVTPGTPAVDLGGVPPAPAPPPEPGSRQAPRFVARSSSGLGTIEATSPRLSAALAALDARPSPAAYLAVAAAYRALRIDDRAFDYLSAGVAEHPRDAVLHEALARAWRDWGFPERGLRDAHLAVRYAPASATAHNTLGTLLWALSHHADAAAAFAAALTLDPGASYAQRNLCLAAAALGRPAPASCPAIPVGTPVPPTP